MLKLREMYKSPSSRDHYVSWLLTGVCLATTSSLVLVAASEAWYALLVAPAIAWISMAFARRMRRNRMRFKSRSALAFTVINLAVFFAFVLLLR